MACPLIASFNIHPTTIHTNYQKLSYHFPFDLNVSLCPTLHYEKHFKLFQPELFPQSQQQCLDYQTGQK